ncbi:uncharacterized protein LOC111686986 [Lucilia cuprina]|uniref:uncharacterized protein LOC111686986 n=1 Tax=Lucilia cuprina TaxID=7375 RepID=UPI001F05C8B6|nr:uncharacterized protein LOC111686986 [Lucilia cuprina]
MKCWSRSTLGVIIGILNILIYLIVSIAMIGLLQSLKSHLDATVPEHKTETAKMSTIILSTVLAVCLAMIIVSGILIMGIVKRHHKFMVPWLVLSSLGFVCDCGRVIITLIMNFINDNDPLHILMVFVLGVLMCALEALILWPIYTLWHDIHHENKVKPGHIVGGVHYENDAASTPLQYNVYTSTPQKS